MKSFFRFGIKYRYKIFVHCHCRLHFCDLFHLILNVGNLTPGSVECFHSSQFASSMTLHNRGLMQRAYSQSQEISKHCRPIRDQETARSGQCTLSEWVWNTLKTCFVAAWIHIVTMYFTEYWIDISFCELEQGFGLKNRDTICHVVNNHAEKLNIVSKESKIAHFVMFGIQNKKRGTVWFWLKLSGVCQ